jgi:hypothetical protein
MSAAPGLSFVGILAKANALFFPLYVENTMIIGTSVLIASIASRL